MQKVVLVFLFAFAACGNTSPVTDDTNPLDSAPPGGGYEGFAQLTIDECDGFDPNDPIYAPYFKPIGTLAHLHPLNKEQMSFDFASGNVYLRNMTSTKEKDANGKSFWHIAGNNEWPRASTISIPVLDLKIANHHLTGTAVFTVYAYDPVEKVKYEILCNIAYKFDFSKYVNYEYGGPPPSAISTSDMQYRTGLEQ